VRALRGRTVQSPLTTLVQFPSLGTSSIYLALGSEARYLAHSTLARSGAGSNSHGGLGPRRTNGRIDTRRGCETERHLEQALALGRRWPGWYFARPGPSKTSRHPQNLSSNSTGASSSAFSIRGRGFFGDTHCRKAFFSHFTTPGEPGLVLGNPPVVVSAFQSAERFTPDTAKRYSRLAERCPLVRHWRRSKSEPAPGVRGVELSPDDPVSGEW